MFAFGFVVPMFEFGLVFGLVAVPGVVLMPVVPVEPEALPAPTAPFVLSGVVVVGGAPVVDCGVVVVVPIVPVVDCGVVVVVPAVEGVVSTVGGVAACPLTEPGVPAVPVPTSPVVPA